MSTSISPEARSYSREELQWKLIDALKDNNCYLDELRFLRERVKTLQYTLSLQKGLLEAATIREDDYVLQ